MENEVVMPLDSLTTAKTWTRLPVGFLKALETARQCVGNDMDKFAITCVHIIASNLLSEKGSFPRSQIKSR